MPLPLQLSRDEWKLIVKAISGYISEFETGPNDPDLQDILVKLGPDGVKAADLGVSPYGYAGPDASMYLFRCPSCQGTDFTAHYMIPAQQRSVLTRGEQGAPHPVDHLGGEESLGEPGPDDYYICRGCSAEISPDGTVISGSSDPDDDDDLPL